MREVRRYWEGLLLQFGEMVGQFIQRSAEPEPVLSRGFCQFRELLYQRAQRLRHGCIADMYCVDRIASHHGDVILIFIRAGDEIVNHRDLEEIGGGQQILQPTFQACRHTAEVEVHRCLSAHASPGSSKVDHRHLYLPVEWLPAAPQKHFVTNRLIWIRQCRSFWAVMEWGCAGKR